MFWLHTAKYQARLSKVEIVKSEHAANAQNYCLPPHTTIQDEKFIRINIHNITKSSRATTGLFNHFTKEDNHCFQNPLCWFSYHKQCDRAFQPQHLNSIQYLCFRLVLIKEARNHMTQHNRICVWYKKTLVERNKKYISRL